MPAILVVDDDELMCELLGVHLRDAGYTASACLDGAEEIHSVLAQKPDLVLLDLNMPYIDGFELLKAFKGDVLTSAIPVIVLTSRTDMNSLERVMAMGAADYLTKPIRVEQLIESVARVLGQGA